MIDIVYNWWMEPITWFDLKIDYKKKQHRWVPSKAYSCVETKVKIDCNVAILYFAGVGILHGECNIYSSQYYYGISLFPLNGHFKFWFQNVMSYIQISWEEQK